MIEVLRFEELVLEVLVIKVLVVKVFIVEVLVVRRYYLYFHLLKVISDVSCSSPSFNVFEGEKKSFKFFLTLIIGFVFTRTCRA